MAVTLLLWETSTNFEAGSIGAFPVSCFFALLGLYSLAGAELRLLSNNGVIRWVLG